jgi:hypothetical protein
VSYVLRASCAFGFWGTYCLKVRTAAGASRSSSSIANASGGAGAASSNEHSSAAAAAAANDAGEVVSLEDLSSKVAQVYQR